MAWRKISPRNRADAALQKAGPLWFPAQHFRTMRSPEGGHVRCEWKRIAADMGVGVGTLYRFARTVPQFGRGLFEPVASAIYSASERTSISIAFVCVDRLSTALEDIPGVFS